MPTAPVALSPPALVAARKSPSRKLPQASAVVNQASKMAAPATSAAVANAAANLAVTPWVSARPNAEKSATTGTVASNPAVTSLAQMKVTLKKGGAYTFSAAYGYGFTGKKPTFSLFVTDSAGKVIKSSSSSTLQLTRTDTDKLADGEFTINLRANPAKGYTAGFNSYRINAQQDLSPLPSATRDSALNAVLAGKHHWWHDEGVVAQTSSTAVTPTVNQITGAKTTLYYDFLDGDEAYLSTADKNGFTAMNAGQESAVESALAYLSSLVNVQFVKSEAQANITFGTNTQSGSAGYAYYPHSTGSAPSRVMLSTSYVANLNDTSSYDFYTLIHEVGHAMGLKHPGNYNAGGGGASGPYLPKALDNRHTTVMSYNTAAGSKDLQVTVNGGSYSYVAPAITPSSYKVLDIAALQYLYGANTSTVTADYIATDNDKSFKAFWAPKGMKVDASATTRTNVFDLRAGYYSSISIRTANDQVSIVKSDLTSQGLSEGQAQSLANTLVNNTKSLKGQIFDGKKTLGLAWGSTFSVVKGGSAGDAFYASNYSSTVDGGAGVDTLYLQGSAQLWSETTVSANEKKYTHVTSGSVITARGIEAIKYYSSTAAMVA